MTLGYSFLENYVCRNYGGPRTKLNSNIFYEISEKEIREGENILGFPFPSELRQFYQEIGTGFLTTPYNPLPSYTFSGSNEILQPLAVAHFGKGELEWEGQQDWISPTFVEDFLEPGDLPFFDIADSSLYMVLKTQSDNPNAVWYMGRLKIEDSFETFIRNLYYEDPAYYERKL